MTQRLMADDMTARFRGPLHIAYWGQPAWTDIHILPKYDFGGDTLNLCRLYY